MADPVLRPGFSWASLSAWIALIAMAIYLIFVATHKTDAENYSKGASHNEVTIAPVQNNYPLSIPGCGRFLTVQTPDGVKFTDLDKKVPVKK